MHVAAVITSLGVLVATAAGYAALLDWAVSHGRLRRAGVEGTSSHGTALNRQLARNRVHVIEVNRPNRAVRRRRGKTDAIDAENAARAVLTDQATAVAKRGDGAVEMIRLFKIAKDSATKARTQTINQLRAVLARTEPDLREVLAGLGPVTLIRRCAELSDTGTQNLDGAAVHVLRALACRVRTLNAEIRSHRQHLTTIIGHPDFHAHPPIALPARRMPGRGWGPNNPIRSVGRVRRELPGDASAGRSAGRGPVGRPRASLAPFGLMKCEGPGPSGRRCGRHCRRQGARS